MHSACPQHRPCIIAGSAIFLDSGLGESWVCEGGIIRSLADPDGEARWRG